MGLFGRKIRLVIESTTKSTKTFSTDDGFTIEFKIDFGKRATGTIKIFNVLRSTVDMCLPKDPGTKKVQYAKVELYAGYGDDLRKITSSNIISHEFKRSGVDAYLEIKTGAIVDILQNNYVVETFENFPVNSILRSIFANVGIVNYEINLLNDKIIPKISFNGTLQQALVELAKNSKSKFFERNGNIVFESQDAVSKSIPNYVILSPTSGLVGYPEIKGKSLKVVSLLNHNLTTGDQFELKMNNDINNMNGFYKIGDGSHFGGNKIDSFFTEFECVKA